MVESYFNPSANAPVHAASNTKDLEMLAQRAIEQASANRAKRAGSTRRPLLRHTELEAPDLRTDGLGPEEIVAAIWPVDAKEVAGRLASLEPETIREMCAEEGSTETVRRITGAQLGSAGSMDAKSLSVALANAVLVEADIQSRAAAYLLLCIIGPELACSIDPGLEGCERAAPATLEMGSACNNLSGDLKRAALELTRHAWFGQ